MAALKWIVVAVFSLGALGALALGFTAAPGEQPKFAQSPAIALRPYPAGTLGGATAAPSKPADKPAEVAKADPPADKPAEVAKADPPKADPPKADPPKADPPKADPPKPAEVAKAEPPKADPPKADPPKADPPKADPPKVDAPKAPPPAPVAKAPAAEGVLNLRASDTADVYLDGKKIGGSPLLGVKVKTGNHKVRFDCYDAAGNTIAGPVQTVAAKPDAEVDVEFSCPTE